MKLSDFFLGVFLKIEYSYHHAIVQKNRAKNGSIVHFEQKV